MLLILSARSTRYVAGTWTINNSDDGNRMTFWNNSGQILEEMIKKPYTVIIHLNECNTIDKTIIVEQFLIGYYCPLKVLICYMLSQHMKQTKN